MSQGDLIIPIPPLFFSITIPVQTFSNLQIRGQYSGALWERVLNTHLLPPGLWTALGNWGQRDPGSPWEPL